MPVEQIIQLGEFASTPPFGEIFKNIPAWTFIFLGLAGLSFVMVFICIIRNDDEVGAEFSMILFLVFLCIGVCGLVLNHFDSVEREVNDWKIEVAYPYITSQPVEKSEVINIKIDPELSHEVRGSLYFTHSKEVRRTPIAVTFNDNGTLVTETQWVETEMGLTEEEKPYVEYQRLNQDIGNGLTAGYYNLKIYLPADYSFTEIK